MATYPCSWCGARYRGPQQTAYPAVVDGTIVFRERMRLCPECFRRVVTADWLTLVGAGPEEDRSVCSLCEVNLGRWAIFVTYYEDRQERQDLYGRSCNDCLGDRVLIALYGPSARVQAHSALLPGAMEPLP